MANEAKPAADKTVEEGKVFAFFGYWGILCLIPLLAKKDNAFALYHGKQGLVLFIGEVIIAILAIIPFLGWFIIGPIGGLLCLVLAIIGMVNSLSGKMVKLPIIGSLGEKIKI